MITARSEGNIMGNIMKKYIILLATGCLLFGYMNCSNNEFAQTGGEVGNLQCLDQECSRFKVTEKAYNPAEQKVTDIMFVFDNSGTMREENEELATKMNGFIQALDQNGVDYNICYTVAERRFDNDGEIIDRLLEWTNGETVLTNKTPQIADIFFNSTDLIKSDYIAKTEHEEPIAMSNIIFSNPANRDCFRNQTALNLVYLSDEDERSDGTNLDSINEPGVLIDKAKSTFGNVPFLVHSIIASDEDDTCYRTAANDNVNAQTLYNLSKLTDGTVGNICSDNYANQLDDIYKKIEKTLDSIVLKCDPIPGTIQISSTNNIGYRHEQRDGRLLLTPGVQADDDATITYDCVKN